MRVRGGSGLGDSIYLRPVVDHLERAGKAVTVMSHYPDVFIGTRAEVIPVNKSRPVDCIAHYTTERFRQTSTQWQDILRTGKLPADLALRFTWNPRNVALLERVKRDAGGDPIVLVHGGRAPFGRSDGYGKFLMPRQEGFKEVLEVLSGWGKDDRCFTVRIGQGEQYRLPVNLDLTDHTSVSDLLDLATICDGVITQCGFPVPLAECFGKPVLGVWSARGLAAGDKVIRSITPAKVLCGGYERFIIDEWPIAQIHEVARSWRADALRETVKVGA